MNKIPFIPAQEGRYDRHSLIPWWDQQRLASARVLVAGAGALGNETLKLLALMGVGRLVVVDFDVVSNSNLSRAVLFRPGDLGRPKVEAAAERVRDLNPAVQIRGVYGDLRFDLGLGEYREADVVLGCLDSVNARWALNRKCLQAGVTWFDAGISDFHGQVTHYSPQAGACYECTFTEATYARFNRRYSCPYGLLNRQANGALPTTAISASLTAALQVQEAVAFLHGRENGLKPGQRLTVQMNPYHLAVDQLPPNNPDCLAHDPLPVPIPVLEVDWQATTLVDIIRRARAWLPGAHTLELPYELVAGFACPSCGNRARVLRPKEKIYHDEALCPACGALRHPELLSAIPLASPLAGCTPGDFGLPAGEILAFLSDTGRAYIELKDGRN